jgi:IMP cyclohydrolase
MQTIDELLASRPYPGRGVLVVRTLNGSRCFVYFVTGRSEASQRRRLVVLDGGDIAVEDSSSEVASDPLRHYVAVVTRGDLTVVGNGSHVTPLAEALHAGIDPVRAFAPHTFEPDDPVFTPRIWAAATPTGGAESLLGSVVRSDRPDGAADHGLWSLGPLVPGSGVLLSTYDGDQQVPRSARLPLDVTTSARDTGEVLDELWSAVDPAVRVTALAVDPDAFDSTLRIVHAERHWPAAS